MELFYTACLESDATLMLDMHGVYYCDSFPFRLLFKHQVCFGFAAIKEDWGSMEEAKAWLQSQTMEVCFKQPSGGFEFDAGQIFVMENYPNTLRGLSGGLHSPSAPL